MRFVTCRTCVALFWFFHLSSTCLQADIAYPSRLETNMGPMTFAKNIGGQWVTWYDYSHTDTQHPAIYSNCAAGKTVRACFQEILSKYKTQGISGIRFQFEIGSALDASNNLIPAWLTGLNNFFQDVRAAGILNVTPTTGVLGSDPAR